MEDDDDEVSAVDQQPVNFDTTGQCCPRCKSTDLVADEAEVICSQCGCVVRENNLLERVEVYTTNQGQLREHGTFVKHSLYKVPTPHRFVRTTDKEASLVCIYMLTECGLFKQLLDSMH